MLDTASFISFLLVALVVIVVPGPSVVFVIGRAMILGTRGAVLSVFGNAAGVGLQIIAVALGVGSLVYASPIVFGAIKVLGAAFLMYLGVQGILHRKQFSQTLETGAKTSTRRVLADSFLVGITNAKTLVFFIATFPLFVNPAVGSVIVQMLILGGAFFVIGVTSDVIWALAAGHARKWLAQSSERLEWVRLAGGVALVGLGAYLGIYSLFG